MKTQKALTFGTGRFKTKVYSECYVTKMGDTYELHYPDGDIAVVMTRRDIVKFRELNMPLTRKENGKFGGIKLFWVFE